MKLSVFGLGYVGTVSAACFAAEGHDVIGVDVNPTKVDIINSGHSPVIEAGIDEMISGVVSDGKLRATTDVEDAVNNSEVSLVCVGTPSNGNGSLRLDYIERSARQIGEVLSKSTGHHTIVARSTMLPGTIEGTVVPVLEAVSGRKNGEGFDVCVNPEFLREGTSIKDFYSPPFTLIGSGSKRAETALRELYSSINAPIVVTNVKAAEMVKYACNSFHGLKISFANEIGNICKEMGIDSHEVMDVFCKDTKLNLSSYYLKPGFAYGGSCLPKDLRALQYKAKELDLKVPVLDAVSESNLLQIERAIQMIVNSGKKKVGVLGFAFKAGTDDLRESPIVNVIERLIGKGYSVRVYDREVTLAKLVGANKEYIENEIPHISALMAPDVDSVVNDCEVIVIGNRSPEFRGLENRLTNGTKVIDLVRMSRELSSNGHYDGICW